MAKLVGEQVYLAAGGRVERDLFAGEGEGQWLDRGIAEDLARAKLQEAAAEIMQLGTLGWVRVVLAQHVPHNETEGLHDYYIRRGELSDDDQARMTAIEERLQAIEEEIEDATDQDVVLRLEAENEALDAEHTEINKRSYVIPEDERPNVGTFIVLASDGTPKVSHRYFSTAAPKREKRAATITEDGAEPAAIENVFPRSLEEQLAKERRDVLPSQHRCEAAWRSQCRADHRRGASERLCARAARAKLWPIQPYRARSRQGRADRPPHAIEPQTSAPKASAIRGAGVSPKSPVSDPLFDFLEQPGHPDHRGRWPNGRHVG